MKICVSACTLWAGVMIMINKRSCADLDVPFMEVVAVL